MRKSYDADWCCVQRSQIEMRGLAHESKVLGGPFRTVLISQCYGLYRGSRSRPRNDSWLLTTGPVSTQVDNIAVSDIKRVDVKLFKRADVSLFNVQTFHCSRVDVSLSKTRIVLQIGSSTGILGCFLNNHGWSSWGCIRQRLPPNVAAITLCFDETSQRAWWNLRIVSGK